MPDSFPFELVSPERLLVSEQVESVVIPGSEGEMTVMAHHAPVMTTLKPGVIRVHTASGQDTTYVAFGGFADITPQGCTVLAESALPSSQFSREDLQRRVEATRAEIAATSDEPARTKLEEFLQHLAHVEDALE